MKNFTASVSARLKNIMKKTEEPYNEICRQYVQERFLARLATSEYRDFFVLKGGILFHVWTGEKFRPTKDLDFAYFGDFDREELLSKVQKVWQKDIPEEAISFHPDTLRYIEIKEDHEYDGIRITFMCKIGDIRIPMQLDICTGDRITPHTRELAFPAILDNEAPILKTYPIETVLAEKVHAMISLDLGSSRLKDYYDAYSILSKMDSPFEMNVVKRAIAATFLHRGYSLPATPIAVWTSYFSEDSEKIKLWKQLIKRIKSDATLELKDACAKIAHELNPIFDDIRSTLAKAAIYMEFGSEVTDITVEKVENQEIFLSYNRLDDDKLFKYKVKIDDEKIIWAAIDMPRKKVGRWRDTLDDSKISYTVTDEGIKLTVLYTDGSAKSANFPL